MAELQGLVSFPGIKQFESATINLAHGISPSTSTISVAPQFEDVASHGDVTITFGNVRETLKDCKLDSGSVNYDQSGAIVSLAVLDRRWKWAFGSISGAYNRRLPDGLLDIGNGNNLDDTERTPQALARLLFDAMGEKGYDVSALPNDARPLAEWDAAVPAQALARLCDELGCHVAIELRKGNKAKIVKVGKGAKLPNGPIMSDSLEVNPAEQPDGVQCVCGYNRYQVDLELEAVGIETDGRVLPINELSYKPATGWSQADLQDFMMIADRATRELAKKSIYKMFRAVVPAEIPGFDVQNLPGFGQVQGRVSVLSQILPLGTEQVETEIYAGRKRAKPAIVYGKWWVGDDANDGNTTDSVTPYVGGRFDNQLVTRPFAIDRENGIVTFDDRIYATDADANVIAPTLRLRTSVGVRDRATRAFARYTKRRATPGKKHGTADKAVKHDDLVLGYYPSYDNRFKVLNVRDNQKDVDKECDEYLKAALEEFQTETPASRTYAGIVTQEIDGAIQAITFTIDGNGTRTVIHRNHDPGSDVSLPFKVKQELERNKAARDAKAIFGVDAVARLGKQAGL